MAHCCSDSNTHTDTQAYVFVFHNPLILTPNRGASPASSLLFELVVDHEHGNWQWSYFGGIYAK